MIYKPLTSSLLIQKVDGKVKDEEEEEVKGKKIKQKQLGRNQNKRTTEWNPYEVIQIKSAFVLFHATTSGSGYFYSILLLLFMYVTI